MTKIQIKRLGVADLSSVISLGLERNEFQCTEEDDFWSAEELRSWLESPKDICAGAVRPDGPMKT